MSDPSHNRASICPGCGAPIDLGNGPTMCVYCRTFVEPPKADQPPPAPSFNVMIGGMPTVGRTARRGCGTGLFVLIALIVAGVAIPIVLATSKGTKGISIPGIKGPIGGRENFNVDGAAVPLPPAGEGATPPDLVVRISNFTSGSTVPEVRYVEGGTGKIRWATKDLDQKHGRDVQLAGDETTVYLADQAALKALNRADGKVRWQASIGSAAADSCKRCIDSIGGRVVVLGRDGTVQAFDSGTGAGAWTQRNADSPRDLRRVGGTVGVVTKAAPPATSGSGLVVYELASGTPHHVDPTCPGPFKDSPDRPNSSDPFIVTPDGAGLVVIFSGSSGCALRIDLLTGGTVWRDVIPDAEPWPFILRDDAVILTDDRILISDDSFVIALGLDGTRATVTLDKRFAVTPIGLRGGRLVVKVVPDFDRDHPEIWGLDPGQPANPVWKRPVTGGATDNVRAFLSSAGLNLIECISDTKTCTFSTIEPVGGTQLAQGKGTGIFTAAFLDEIRDSNFGYYTSGTKLFVVKHATSHVVIEVGRG